MADASAVAASLEKRWLLLCEQLGVQAVDADAPARWWGLLESLYSEPARAYHTLSHLDEMFGYLDSYANVLTDVQAVSLAIFFHDIIYDARAGSPKNEADSARVFEEFGQEVLPAGDPPGRAKSQLIDKVSRWIVQTAHHKCDAGDDKDCKLFMDFDMAVLGRPWPAYEAYSQQIRQEYIHVPEAIYCQARGGFLAGFSAGSAPIFATEVFRAEREARARENAAREAAALQERFNRCSTLAQLSSRVVLWLKAAPRKHALSLKVGALAAAAAAAVAKPQVVLSGIVAGLAGFTLVVAPLSLWLAFGSCFQRYPYQAPSQRAGVAVIAGSLNPPHLGHLEMIAHLAASHTAVHVVIGVNPNKRYDVSPFERQELVRLMLLELGVSDVKVVVNSGIIWRYARSVGAVVMYRGIRSWRLDGVAEKWLEFLNVTTQLASACRPIPTVYLQANPRVAHVSSTLVRDRIARGEDISDLVPMGCAGAVAFSYGKK